MLSKKLQQNETYCARITHGRPYPNAHHNHFHCNLNARALLSIVTGHFTTFCIKPIRNTCANVSTCATHARQALWRTNFNACRRHQCCGYVAWFSGRIPTINKVQVVHRQRGPRRWQTCEWRVVLQAILCWLWTDARPSSRLSYMSWVWAWTDSCCGLR